MTTQPRRFVLQAIDPDHGSPAFEAMFIVERPEELQSFLGEAAKDDPELQMNYWLEPAETAAISKYFDVPFESDGREVSLYQWTQSREAPYLIHGGYELALMIEGRKPFARMGGDYYPPHRHWNEDRFDHYVAQCLLHKEVELEKLDEPYRLQDGRVLEGLRTVYYTLKGEEWRIAAWKLVSKASSKSGWNDDFERLEGMLLGYEEWQNDWWAEKRKQQRHQYGTSLVYLAVSPSHLAGIEDAGYRSLPPATSAIRLVSAFGEETDDREPSRLMEMREAVALVRFRVKTRSFLELVGDGQQRHHEVPPERIKGLNRLILGEIEIIARRDV